MNKDYNENDELNMDLDLETLYADAMPAPDLWGRIEAGVRESTQQVQNTAGIPLQQVQQVQPATSNIVDMEALRAKRARRRKLIGVLAAAAVLMLIAIPTIILTNGKRDSVKESGDRDKKNQSIALDIDGSHEFSDSLSKQEAILPAAEETEAAAEEAEAVAEDTEAAAGAIAEETEAAAEEADAADEAPAEAARQENSADRQNKDMNARNLEMFEGELLLENGEFYLENTRTPITYNADYTLEHFRITNPEVLDGYTIEEGKPYPVSVEIEKIDWEEKTVTIKKVEGL